LNTQFGTNIDDFGRWKIMCDKKFISFSFIYLAVIVVSISGFNVSPTPNYVFSAPKSNSTRSSYFGLAVTLRQDR
jgi:hypothetical protein